MMGNTDIKNNIILGGMIGILLSCIIFVFVDEYLLDDPEEKYQEGLELGRKQTSYTTTNIISHLPFIDLVAGRVETNTETHWKNPVSDCIKGTCSHLISFGDKYPRKQTITKDGKCERDYNKVVREFIKGKCSEYGTCLHSFIQVYN